MSVLLQKLAEGHLPTERGEFSIHVFHDGSHEAIVLTLGDLTGETDLLCRIHSECVLSQAFGFTGCDCRSQLDEALAAIQQRGRGLVIYLRQDGRGNGIAARVHALARQGRTDASVYEAAGFEDDARTYNIAAKVLAFFGVRSVHVVGANVQKLGCLERHNIKITGSQYFLDPIVLLGRRLDPLVNDIREGRHRVTSDPADGRKRVLIVGDLNMRYVADRSGGAAMVPSGPPIPSGSALCAAMAVLEKGYLPVVSSSVADDEHGRRILDMLRSSGVRAFVSRGRGKSTPGRVSIAPPGERRQDVLINEPASQWLNPVDPADLEQTIALTALSKRDAVLLLLDHALVDGAAERMGAIVGALADRCPRVVVEVAESAGDSRVDSAQLRSLAGRASALIVDLQYLTRALGADGGSVTNELAGKALELLGCRYLVARSVDDKSAGQGVYRRTPDGAGVEHLPSPAAGRVERARGLELDALSLQRNAFTAAFLHEHWDAL